jgi:type IV pilus assembly protein PilO
MTSRTQRAICLALMVIGAVPGLWLVSAAWSARDAVEGKTLQLTRELDDKQHITASHAQYSTQLEEMREMLAQVMRQLPSRLDHPALEKSLRDQAARAGAAIELRPMGAESVREGFYAELPVEIVVQGSSAQFLNFMDALQHEIPLRQVSALTIAAVDGATTLRATMTLEFFRYIEEGE